MGLRKKFIFGSNVNVNTKLKAGNNGGSRRSSWNLYDETNFSHPLPSGIFSSVGW
jgi:hypothetical protein